MRFRVKLQSDFGTRYFVRVETCFPLGKKHYPFACMLDAAPFSPLRLVLLRQHLAQARQMVGRQVASSRLGLAHAERFRVG